MVAQQQEDRIFAGHAPIHTPQLTVRAEGSSIVLLVSGEVDMATAPTVQECLDGVMADCSGSVIVDLGGVTFLDSSGIAVLVRAHCQLQGAARDLGIRNPTPIVRGVLTVTGIDDLVVDPA